MSRLWQDRIFATATRLALAICLAVLLFLLGSILVQGLKAVSPQFWLTPSREFGQGGGILYQILGSLLMVGVAGAFAAPLALGTAVFRGECVSPRFARIIDLTLLSLNGVPSIAFGIFGLIFFVNWLNTGISWVVGGVILGMMVLPIATLSTVQAINSIASEQRDNARALGLKEDDILRRIIIPQSLHGLVTGLLIGLARAIGETAPIMFIATAFSGVRLPHSAGEPVVSLPTHILALAQQATDPAALANGWGASLTLVMLVMTFAGLALFARRRLAPLSRR